MITTSEEVIKGRCYLVTYNDSNQHLSKRLLIRQSDPEYAAILAVAQIGVSAGAAGLAEKMIKGDRGTLILDEHGNIKGNYYPTVTDDANLDEDFHLSRFKIKPYIITDKLLVAAILANILQRDDSDLDPDAKNFLMRRAKKLNIIQAD